MHPVKAKSVRFHSVSSEKMDWKEDWFSLRIRSRFYSVGLFSFVSRVRSFFTFGNNATLLSPSG